VEGILVLYEKEIRDQFDMKIFVDTDADLRLARRIRRDIRERGRTIDTVLDQYISTVKPAFDEFIHPTKRHADLIIPWSDNNPVAVDLLVQHIRTQLENRRVDFSQSFSTSNHLTNPMPTDAEITKLATNHITSNTSSTASNPSVSHPVAPTTTSTSNSTLTHDTTTFNPNSNPLSNPSSNPSSNPNSNPNSKYNISSVNPIEINKQLSEKWPSNVKVVERSPSLRIIHTTIRDINTTQDELIFAVARLSFLLFTHGLDLIDFEKVQVTTPTEGVFVGCQLPDQICGVSIVRSGEALEKTMRELFPSSPIGKIVIKQAQDRVQGPRLYYCKFPSQIKSYKVILMDAILSTGNAAIMAVHVLLDHGVLEENIYFFSLIAAPQGLNNLLRSFPRIKVATSWIEDGLDDRLFPVPGFGPFGDRYFGTSISGSTDDLKQDVNFTLR